MQRLWICEQFLLRASSLLEQTIPSHLLGRHQGFSASFPAEIICRHGFCPLSPLPHPRHHLPADSLWLHVPCSSLLAQAFRSVKITAVLHSSPILVQVFQYVFRSYPLFLSGDSQGRYIKACSFQLAPRAQIRCRCGFQRSHLIICLLSASSSGDTGGIWQSRPSPPQLHRCLRTIHLFYILISCKIATRSYGSTHCPPHLRTVLPKSTDLKAAFLLPHNGDSGR